jgi:ribonuclease R
MFGKDVEFDGIISGVTEWGLFVEITETKCEGLVRMSEITNDFYEFEKDKFRIVGKRYGKAYSLGGEVKVRVRSTDLEKRTIDLQLVVEVK